MTGHEQKSLRRKLSSLFNYSYVVLCILLLLSVGATVAYYQNAELFYDDSGSRWSAVVFLIGFCISLLIFGITHREATARATLLRKTLDLLATQKENRSLLKAEQESRIAAERANLAKDEFLAVVSHELRTPLNAIAGWTRILRSDGLSDEARETALQKIDKNLKVQTEIVDELLNFSDVMSAGPRLRVRPVRIRRVIEEAINSVSVSAFQKGITLATELELGDLKVYADRERLKMAIGNVISNAVKFTPNGGSISVSGRAMDGEIACIVTDDGLGISPEFLPHVFEKYTQSELASTRHFGGLGLGLTIAQHILKLHHGSIEAESTGAGEGATFTIHIPLKPPVSSSVR